MPYLELVNSEFQHYFIVDYPTDIPYNPIFIKNNKNKKCGILKKLIKLFKNKK